MAASSHFLLRSLAAHPDARAAVRLAPHSAPGARGAFQLEVLRVPATAEVGEHTEMIAVNLATIQGYIDKINDTCDQVDEALEMANATMAQVLGQMQPAVDGALGMLDKASIAADAASTFGVSDMGTWVTQFTDKMSVKVVDFSTKLTDMGAQLQDDLEIMRAKFATIKANTLDKFADAFGQVSKLVEVVVDIVEATKIAIEISGKGNAVMLRHPAATALPMQNVSISRGDLSTARALYKRGEVSSRAVSMSAFAGLNAKTLENVKAAIAEAKAVLEPLLAALAELFKKIRTGVLGQVLDEVEEGVGELNQTAFDAVEAAKSALPGMIKSQMQGLFNGVLSVVGQVSATVEEQLGKITSKLKEANETEAHLGEATVMMDDVVDGVSPIFQDSSSARLVSTGCVLLWAACIAIAAPFDF